MTNSFTDLCPLPGCDGVWHDDDTCVARLPEVEFEGQDVCLTSELVAYGYGAPHIVAFVSNMASLDTRRELWDRASASEFTAQLRRLADAIDGAASILPS